MAGLGLNLGAGLSQGYSQSANSGGSVNSAENNNYSYNTSWNDAMSDAFSQALAWTDAWTARQWSAQQADKAWERNYQAFREEMDFNREEAAKQRAWQAEMANSIYTRSTKNMKEAGINPILAYNMGLSGAGVGSGATASLGGSPSAPLAQNFMDSFSASNSNSHSEQHGGSFGESWGTGTQSGSSWNSGWSNSEEGIVTALQGLSGMANSAIAGINAGNTLQDLTKSAGGKIDKWADNAGNAIKNWVVKGVNNVVDGINQKISNRYYETNEDKKGTVKNVNGGGGGHGFNKKMKSF